MSDAGLVVVAATFAVVTGVNDGGSLLATRLKVPSVRTLAAVGLLAASVAVAPILLGTRVAATLTHRLVSVFGALDGAREEFLLDGFPRTVGPARAARAIARRRGLLAQLAIQLVVTDEEVARRLLARGQGRPDDTECVIRRRLALYHEVATPLPDFYRHRGLLVEIDGMPPIDRVTEAIFAVVDATRARSA